MDDWTETRVGRAFHRLVVGPISHEEYRRMIRETYPAQLPPADSGWARRFGPEVKGQAVDIRFPSHPETAEMAETRRRLRALLDRYPGTWPAAPAYVHVALRAETPSDGANRMARLVQDALRAEDR